MSKQQATAEDQINNRLEHCIENIRDEDNNLENDCNESNIYIVLLVCKSSKGPMLKAKQPVGTLSMHSLQTIQ